MKGLIEELKKREEISKKKAIALEREVQTTGKREEEVILEDVVLNISEKDLFSIKGEILGIPLKDDVNIDKLGSILTDIAKLVPRESAEHYSLVPINKRNDKIVIGMVYPKDLKAQEVLRFLSRRGGFSYEVVLITPSLFQEVLNEYEKLRQGAGAALGQIEEEQKKEKQKIEKRIGKEKEDDQEMAEKAPIVRVVSVILEDAIEGGASDIHIEPGRDELEVRFRIDGILHSSLILPKKIHRAVIARIKILSNLRIEEKRLPQDGRFLSDFNGKKIDFRVSTMPTTMGEKAVLRVLDPEDGIKKVGELGMGSEDEKKVIKGVNQPTGMMLATGPTGSGKTTTLYSLLRDLNTEEVNIVTLEDPVEYFIDGVNQSQVKHDIGYDFSNGLRQILRQDPDIIMVGEIRDQETAELAVHAALTGHIVLSTLHTNDAIGVIPRLIDMGIQPYLLPPALNAAIAQRLVRRLCDCKREVSPSPAKRKVIEKELESLPVSKKSEINFHELTIYEPEGCEKCGGSGYRGRIGIYEILEMTDRLSEMIVENTTEGALRQEADRQGMTTMRQDGILKVLEGITSLEAVLKATKETGEESNK